MSDYKSNAGNAVQSFMTGALIGGAIGVAVALLYAPKKGKNLREDISDTIDDLSSRLNGLLRHAKESGEDLINDGMDAGDELVHEAYKKAESLINEADRIIHEARSRVMG
jgi:gas vesicle protein